MSSVVHSRLTSDWQHEMRGENLFKHKQKMYSHYIIPFVHFIKDCSSFASWFLFATVLAQIFGLKIIM